MKIWPVAMVAALTACAPQGAGNNVLDAADVELSLDNAGDSLNAAEALSNGSGGVGNETDPGQGNGSGWQYDSQRDEMRDATSRSATLTSENDVALSFPYGTVRARIVIRQRPQDGLNVMFIADEGQVLCNSYTNSRLSVKFDDGPVREFGCDGASSGSPEVAFFNAPRDVLAQIRRSRRAIVEAQFYNDGPQQLRFNVAGLNWE